MIRTFRDGDTRDIFFRVHVKGFSREVQRAAYVKLLLLDAAETLEDLRVPPGNRLEKLSGRRRGQYSIRVNDRWRVCFTFNNGAAYDVQVTDYHQG